MNSTRLPAVADHFYPAEAPALRAAVTGYLISADEPSGPTPKVIVAPHAGYIYSGPIAANAYRVLETARSSCRRVVLVGPSHRVPMRGAALSPATRFHTPLGDVEIDQEAYDELNGLTDIVVSEAAHAQEHSLEVHLPFLQVVLGKFQLVPLLFGSAAPTWVAETLMRLWGGPETRIVVSSDLSHYHDYNSACRIDATTTEAIAAFDYERIGSEHACGCVALNGLLLLAAQRRMQMKVLDVRNSGDTAGPRDRVVGYGAYAFYEDSHPAIAL